MSKYQHGLRALVHAILLVAALTAALSLSGCASGVSQSGAGNESFTDSDEPESRKRASNRLRLAVLYFQDGKHSIALDEVKQAISVDPGWFESYNMRGLIYMRTGDMAQAEASFQKALSISPGSADVMHNYGVMMCRQGRFQEGLNLFASAVATSGYAQKSNTLVEQGACQLALGRKADAQDSFTRAFELDPANYIAEANLAQMLLERGDLVRAQFHVRRINNSEQANAETLWLGIKVERRMGNREAQEQLGGQLKKRFPNSKQAAAWDRGAFNE